jgi:hypothetical protein
VAISEQEQKSDKVRQHKRLAMGEKLNGTSLKGSNSKKSGGLSHAKKNK